MRFLFAIAFLGVVLAVAGCTPATKPVTSTPPADQPGAVKIGDKPTIPPGLGKPPQ